MKKIPLLIISLISLFLSLGMARNSEQYDQEAREEEKLRKQTATETQPSENRNPVKNIATGLKEITYDNVRDVTTDTARGTTSEPPIVGTLDGTQQAGEKVVDNTIRGVKKVATLGLAKDDSYEIEESEKGSGDPAKIKLFQF